MNIWVTFTTQFQKSPQSGHTDQLPLYLTNLSVIERHPNLSALFLYKNN